jgi:hypothetical protein
LPFGCEPSASLGPTGKEFISSLQPSILDKMQLKFMSLFSAIGITPSYHKKSLLFVGLELIHKIIQK